MTRDLAGRWFERVLEDYPAESRAFLREQKNRFANPVGAALREGIEGLSGFLFQEKSLDEVRSFLDGIMRLRVAQGFAPAEAVSFLTLLKGVLSQELSPVEWGERKSGLELKMDSLLHEARRIDAACREQIRKIKERESLTRMVR